MKSFRAHLDSLGLTGRDFQTVVTKGKLMLRRSGSKSEVLLSTVLPSEVRLICGEEESVLVESKRTPGYYRMWEGGDGECESARTIIDMLLECGADIDV